ncbi:MAG: hypothetical protein HY927_00420 [Elusimicrobia bacterium]|nr:hypothetical protein [Elusimicrobiota bacterium]
MSASAGVAVMLNNFMHDLSVAAFFCAALALSVLRRRWRALRDKSPAEIEAALEAAFTRVAGWSFLFIILFGAVRAWTYRDYEWSNAAQHGQLTALYVKHGVFVLLIGCGLWRLRRSQH